MCFVPSQISSKVHRSAPLCLMCYLTFPHLIGFNTVEEVEALGDAIFSFCCLSACETYSNTGSEVTAWELAS